MTATLFIVIVVPFAAMILRTLYGRERNGR